MTEQTKAKVVARTKVVAGGVFVLAALVGMRYIGSAGAVVAGSLSCLVSIPLYYVLERKLVKG